MPSEDLTPASTSVRTRWDIILVAFGAGMVAAGHIGKLPAALPEIRAELLLTMVAAGWIVSVFNAVTILLGMLVGVFADRLGHRRVIVVCLLMMAVGSIWGAVAPTEFVLLLARFAEGVGFVGVVVSAPSIIANAAQPSDRRFALGVWGAFMGTGIAAILLIAPAILEPWGWRALWIVMAAATVLWALMTWLTLRRMAPQPANMAARPDGGWREDFRLTLTRPGLWVLALAFSFYTLQWMALMVWLPTFLVEQRGASVNLAAHLTVVVVLVNVGGNLLGGWLLQRGLSRWHLIGFVGLLSIACGFGIFTSLLPDWLRYLLCILFSGLAGMLPASAMSGAPAFTPTPRQIGAANGLLVQGSNLGQLLGPPAIAMAVALTGGWQAGSWVFLACGSAIVTLALVLLRLESKRPAWTNRDVTSSAD